MTLLRALGLATGHPSHSANKHPMTPPPQLHLHPGQDARGTKWGRLWAQDLAFGLLQAAVVLGPMQLMYRPVASFWVLLMGLSLVGCVLWVVLMRRARASFLVALHAYLRQGPRLLQASEAARLQAVRQLHWQSHVLSLWAVALRVLLWLGGTLLAGVLGVLFFALPLPSLLLLLWTATLGVAQIAAWQGLLYQRHMLRLLHQKSAVAIAGPYLSRSKLGLWQSFPSQLLLLGLACSGGAGLWLLLALALSDEVVPLLIAVPGPLLGWWLPPLWLLGAVLGGAFLRRVMQPLLAGLAQLESSPPLSARKPSASPLHAQAAATKPVGDPASAPSLPVLRSLQHRLALLPLWLGAVEVWVWLLPLSVTTGWLVFIRHQSSETTWLLLALGIGVLLTAGLVLALLTQQALQPLQQWLGQKIVAQALQEQPRMPPLLQPQLLGSAEQTQSSLGLISPQSETGVLAVPLLYRGLAVLVAGSGLLLGLPWLPGVKSRLALGLLMLLLGLLLARRGSRLALSLAQLRGLATQLAQAQQHGQLQSAAPPVTAKEPVAVAALRQALLGMQQSLVDRLAAAARAQEVLEAEISARTAELSARTEQLQGVLTALQKTQAELQRTEEMASVGRLLAGIAHEINNPVNAVLNTAQPLAEALAELQVQPAVDDATWAGQLEELAAMQRVLSRGARRTHEIVQTLRSYTHTEAVPPLPVDVVRCLQEALELISVDQLDLKPALQVTVQVDGQPLILGHFGQLQQLLVNLLSNAVHAVQERCTSSRRQPGSALQPPYQPQLQLSVVQTAQTVQVVVSDNGPGIEPALLSRIFDPFFSTKAATQGMGLGLSIAHNLVSRLGGRLDVKSQPGQGATFTVTLPAAPALATGFHAEAATASAGPVYKG